MIEDIDELVGSAVTEVFDTMLNLKVQQVPTTGDVCTSSAHVAGSVGFIGRLMGVVYIYAPETLAKRVTGILLGLTEAEIDTHEMVNDAMGEIANMVVGHMKSRLSDRGMACILTIPSVVRGSNFSIETVSSTEGRLYSFNCDQERLLVEIMMQSNDQTAN